MYRIFLCDDEPRDLERYTDWLQRISRGGPELSIRRFCTAAAMQFALDGGDCPDVIFLDILMGGGPNGVDTAGELRKKGCSSSLIFLTTSCDFAIPAFEHHPFHYLVKNAGDFANFKRVFLECLQDVQRRRREQFSYAWNEEQHWTPLADILYFEACGHATILHHLRGEEPCGMTLRKVQEKLADKPFVRIHRTYLVNLVHLSALNARQVVLSPEVRLPIGRAYLSRAKMEVMRFLSSVTPPEE